MRWLEVSTVVEPGVNEWKARINAQELSSNAGTTNRLRNRPPDKSILPEQAKVTDCRHALKYQPRPNTYEQTFATQELSPRRASRICRNVLVAVFSHFLVSCSFADSVEFQRKTRGKKGPVEIQAAPCEAPRHHSRSRQGRRCFCFNDFRSAQ